MALDHDWDQSVQKDEALALALQMVYMVEAWVQTLYYDEAEIASPHLSIAQQVKEQDVQVDEKGKASLIKLVRFAVDALTALRSPHLKRLTLTQKL